MLFQDFTLIQKLTLTLHSNLYPWVGNYNVNLTENSCKKNLICSISNQIMFKLIINIYKIKVF